MTLMDLQEYLKAGKLDEHITTLRYQIDKERMIMGGVEQIPTQEELKAAISIREGTFDEVKEVMPCGPSMRGINE
jgi:hypothetical protein